MITVDNLGQLLGSLGFKSQGRIYTKIIGDAVLTVNFSTNKIIYPTGIIIHDDTTSNFSQKENFVVLECVHRLLEKGYKPEHIELEPRWKLGHEQKGGKADILVKDNFNEPVLLIECKTAGAEFNKEWQQMLTDGGQLFSYAHEISKTRLLCLYASDFDNKQLSYSNYVVKHIDDGQHLANNPKLKGYIDAGSSKERFRVWKDTYQQEHSTKALFELNQESEELMGRQIYALSDLKSVNPKLQQSMYHTFATILRQHNVSGRENAFDKLVNLLLCKLVDETENPDNLDFHWKGLAYDTPLELVDRLQKLYKQGMAKFLGEDITYISQADIEQALRFYKSSPDATKKAVWALFEQQKFFTNNDFAFIDVHNKRLFYQNAEVLLKIIRMWQDTRLITQGDEHNQFLGDLFEGFLDQGVKQSEGQFFTPMPICRFIVQSLPLDSIVAQSPTPPKVIDYACGAGHFLNELALRIKPLLANKKHSLQDYHSAIIGIEKEYRLSKVAKVSAFMYGQQDIQVCYGDGLVQQHSAFANIKNDSFDVLVANPPYSVKGFLSTLPDDDKATFNLTDAVNDHDKNGNIEAFFIERAKQLLKTNGVAAIILPSSILSNTGAVMVRAREVLLKYFDIVAITEFASGTFGKTGTNTVTLFLRRKATQPDTAQHYLERVQEWFKGTQNDAQKQAVYQDEYLLANYAAHINVMLDDYKTLLNNTPSPALLAHELFGEYNKAFEKLNEIKNLKRTRQFLALNVDSQIVELNKRFAQYASQIEQEKLYYYLLATSQKHPVLVFNSPEKAVLKKFLGYDWSTRKGAEGIKYFTQITPAPVKDDVEGVDDAIAEQAEDEDQRVLKNMNALSHINTMLYNAQSNDHTGKLCGLVRNAFMGEAITIPENMQQHASVLNLVDMLDFSRVKFEKTIALNAKSSVRTMQSQWPLVKLGDVVNVMIGGTPARSNMAFFTGNNLWVSIAEMNGQNITNTKEKITAEGIAKSNVKLIKKGSTLLSFKLSIGKTAIAGADLYTNEAIAGLVPKSENITDTYLFHLFNAKQIDLQSIGFKAFGKSLNSAFLKEEVEIPLPPLDVQQQIVSECEDIEQVVNDAQKKIVQLDLEVTLKVKNLTQQHGLSKLSSVVNIISGGTPNTEQPSFWNGGIPWLSVADFSKTRRYVSESEKTISKLGLENSNTKFLQIGDLIISARGTVGALAQLTLPMTFNQSCYGLRGKSVLNNGYLFYVLKQEIQQFKNNAAGVTFGAITIKTFDAINIPIPPIDIQTQLVAEIEVIEQQIANHQATINQAASLKQVVMQKYL